MNKTIRLGRFVLTSVIQSCGAPLADSAQVRLFSGEWAKGIAFVPPWLLRWNGRAGLCTERECRALVLGWIG